MNLTLKKGNVAELINCYFPRITKKLRISDNYRGYNPNNLHWERSFYLFHLINRRKQQLFH